MKMPQKQHDFLNSIEASAIREELQRMAKDEAYCTPPSYTPRAQQYPDNQIPFVDKHMVYLSLHPQLDVQSYLANLQLMTKIHSPAR